MGAGEVLISEGRRAQVLILSLLCRSVMLSADAASLSGSSAPRAQKAVLGAGTSAGTGFDASGGKTEEVARALDSFGNSILRLAYSYLHSMEDAEDILQETMIRYMEKAPSFHDAMHEKAWLLRVASNLSKNRIDYNRVRKTDELNEELAAEERADLSFVWECVKKLPESQREAIHLFYEEELSTSQIAEILQENESTVRSHLRRGRDRLKKILKEEYDFDPV